MPEINNPLALLGLLLLIPVIILYLLKPKPKTVRIPTLMFIQYVEKTKRFSSFLKRFIKDPLLLTQLLIMGLLVISISNPSILSEKRQRGDESVVIIIDGSASMQSTDVNPDRFSVARDGAMKELNSLGKKSTVSLILVENVPITLLNKGSVDQAKAILREIEASDTPSNIGDAILLSRDILAGEERKRSVYVFSDFSNTDGMDPVLAKKIVSMDDVDIEFDKIGKTGMNIGIISFSASRSFKDRSRLVLTFTVRNYDSSDHDLDIVVKTDEKPIENIQKRITANSDEFFYLNPKIEPEEQIIRVELAKKDDFPVDDVVSALVEGIRTYSVLLITSRDSDSYLELALRSQPNTKVSTCIPPVIPPCSDYDTIILGSVKKDDILPGTFRDIEQFVRRGGSFIILASDDIGAIENQYFNEMTPVNLGPVTGAIGRIYPALTSHEILGSAGKVEIDFRSIVVNEYYKTTPKNESVVLVKTGDYPLIAYSDLGLGKTVYMGINSDPHWSNFYLSSDFPIIWYRLVGFVNKPYAQIGLSSYKTGKYLSFPDEIGIVTPGDGNLKTSSIFLDKQGTYELRIGNSSSRIIANLLNEKESNITSVTLEEISKKIEIPGTQTFKTKRYLAVEILSIVIAIVLLEAAIYKGRGMI